MSVEHRAKQFLPFTALTELEVAIEEKNKEYNKKLENNNYIQKVKDLKKVIENLGKNHHIAVTYSDPDETIITGEFKKFDPLNKIVIINNIKIPIDSIDQIKALEIN